MTRFHVAPSTVIALLMVLGIASCDPCDPCDDGGQQRATARTPLDLAGPLDLGAPAAR